MVLVAARLQVLRDALQLASEAFDPSAAHPKVILDGSAGGAGGIHFLAPRDSRTPRTAGAEGVRCGMSWMMLQESGAEVAVVEGRVEQVTDVVAADVVFGRPAPGSDSRGASCASPAVGKAPASSLCGLLLR